MIRTPTFFVQADDQRKNLALLRRREQQLTELYKDTKPLCFHAAAYQKTHPVKAARGRKDADATLTTPCCLGVADGVSQIEDFGIDASELPIEMLRHCKTLSTEQLWQGSENTYRGPQRLVREAFERTGNILGSTTIVLALMDNETKIHGKPHPMIAVISIGDCELHVLRRCNYLSEPRLLPVFKTDMQRIDGHMQTPLQIARVDGRIDANFHDDITLEVIDRGSASHCISAYEGDVIVMGSDGLFDNLFTDEVTEIVNTVLRPDIPFPAEESTLAFLARRLVEAAHAKTHPGPTGILPDAPIGRGGKFDDTSCVVAQVVDRAAHRRRLRSRSPVLGEYADEDGQTGGMFGLLHCGGAACSADRADQDEESSPCRRASRRSTGDNSSRRRHSRDESSDDEEETGSYCCVA